jgi:GNAT superfamily N-acetyltransferase
VTPRPCAGTLASVQPAISELEQAAALAWRAPVEERLGGWLLRAAGGFTGRANSALAIGDAGRPVGDAVEAVCRWYEARQLPPMIALPRPLRGSDQCGLDHYLDGLGWHIRSGTAVVMTAETAVLALRLQIAVPKAGTPVVPMAAKPAVPLAGQSAMPGTGKLADAGRPEFSAEPDDAWLSVYNYRGSPAPPIARELLLSAPAQVFVTIRDGGVPVAVGRLGVSCGWGGLTAIEVRPDHRRRGLGTAITAALIAAAAESGTRRIYLQVEEGNTAALALYARCGFRSHHCYHYRVAPR